MTVPDSLSRLVQVYRKLFKLVSSFKCTRGCLTLCKQTQIAQHQCHPLMRKSAQAKSDVDRTKAATRQMVESSLLKTLFDLLHILSLTFHECFAGPFAAVEITMVFMDITH